MAEERTVLPCKTQKMLRAWKHVDGDDVGHNMHAIVPSLIKICALDSYTYGFPDMLHPQLLEGKCCVFRAPTENLPEEVVS